MHSTSWFPDCWKIGVEQLPDLVSDGVARGLSRAGADDEPPSLLTVCIKKEQVHQAVVLAGEDIVLNFDVGITVLFQSLKAESG